MNNKYIKVIFTGGTISMNKDTKSLKIDITDSEDLLENELKKQLPNTNIKFETFSKVPSPFLTINDMFRLTKLIEKNIMSDDIIGIVVSHGTDTLEESAYMSDLLIDSNKPIVFTGSMRNLSEVSYDGIRNLMSAILVASSSKSKNKGTLIVLNDEINAASEASKTHTLSLDTFKSLEFGPLGIIDEQNVIYYRETTIKTEKIFTNKIEDKVEILKISAGSSSVLLNLLVRNKFSGIIIEGLGRGNVPPQIVPSIQLALENDIPVIMTSRAPKGRVLGSYGYEGGGQSLHDMGVIFAPNLNSQKARIKLMACLGSGYSLEKIRKSFEK